MLGIGLCTGMYCMPVSPKAPTFGAGAKNRRCAGKYGMPIKAGQARLFSGMRKHTVPVVAGWLPAKVAYSIQVNLIKLSIGVRLTQISKFLFGLVPVP